MCTALGLCPVCGPCLKPLMCFAVPFFLASTKCRYRRQVNATAPGFAAQCCAPIPMNPIHYYIRKTTPANPEAFATVANEALGGGPLATQELRNLYAKLREDNKKVRKDRKEAAATMSKDLNAAGGDPTARGVALKAHRETMAAIAARVHQMSEDFTAEKARLHASLFSSVSAKLALEDEARVRMSRPTAPQNLEMEDRGL